MCHFSDSLSLSEDIYAANFSGILEVKKWVKVKEVKVETQIIPARRADHQEKVAVTLQSD